MSDHVFMGLSKPLMAVDRTVSQTRVSGVAIYQDELDKFNLNIGG